MNGARVFIDEDNLGMDGKFNGVSIDNFKQQENARARIKDGTYPSKISKGKQNKHIEGTVDYIQNRWDKRKKDPDWEPSVLATGVDAQELVDRYKATGKILVGKKSIYPEEIVKADKIVGKAWITDKQQYIDTDVFKIVYSKNGTHVYPMNPRRG